MTTMRAIHRSTPDDGADKAARIERILGEAVQRLTCGSELDDAALIAQYPELGPELERQLRALRAIAAAAQEVQRVQRHPSSAGQGLSDSPLEEDLHFLRTALTNYEILERINYGGQGVVYRAVQRSTRRTVAIKVLLDGPLATDLQRRRFLREIELTSRLQHPNIVTVYESDVVRGRVYCAMEHVEGVPIDDYVLLHGLPIADIVRLVCTVVRAVSHAHQQGIIHRDLNPGNILVDLDGVPRILDFGLAKDVWAETAARDDVSLTMPGQVVGTLPYLSPEQVGAGDDTVDVRSDIYSLGVVLFELLTGDFPYPIDGPTPRVRANIAAREPSKLRKAVSPDHLTGKRGEVALLSDLEAITLKALAKDKAHRYQSTAAFADDLERALAGEAVEARADRRYYLLHRTLRKHRTAFAVVGLLLVVVAGATTAVTIAWLQALAQRDRAREMTRLALGTINDVVTRVDEAVRPLAGGMEVRDRLLNEVVAERFATLQPLLESDAEMDDLRAAVYEKQGDIAYARGNHAEAADDYQAFLDVSSREAQAAPSAGERLQNIARAHRKLASVSEVADEHLQQAVQLAASLMDQHPDNNAAKVELCTSHTEYGRHLYLEGRYEAAAEQIDVALAIAEPAAASNADDEHWHELLARAYEWDGDIRIALGDGERSVRSLTVALSLCRTLSSSRPADTQRRRNVLLACNKLGTVLRDDGRRAEAKALFEEAVSIGEYLTDVEPSVVGWKRDLAVLHDRLARMYVDAGEYASGKVHGDAALDLKEQLVDQDPDDLQWRRSLAFSCEVRGYALLESGEPDRAYEDFERALAIREKLSAADPADVTSNGDLATSHAWFARCCGRLECQEQAVEHYQCAHDISAALFALQPTVTSRALDLVNSKLNLAAAYLRLDAAADCRTAVGLLLEAADSLEQLRCSGALTARSGWYATTMDAICRNLALADARCEFMELGNGELSVE